MTTVLTLSLGWFRKLASYATSCFGKNLRNPLLVAYLVLIAFLAIPLLTFAQPTLVKDINTTSVSNLQPEQITSLNGIMYFSAQSSEFGRELWRSDGTPEGTFILKDITSGSSSSNPKMFTIVNNTLYFVANHIEINDHHNDIFKNHYDIWKTDGTIAGTVKIGTFPSYRLQEGDLWSYPQLVSFNNTLYFTVYNSSFRFELWKLNGNSPVKVNDSSIAQFSWFGEFTVAGSYLYFAAYGSSAKMSLMRTDGTTQGTIKLRESPVPNNLDLGQIGVSSLAAAGNILYFAFTDENGRELWKSDGTIAGTQLVKDIQPGSQSANPNSFFYANGTLFFRANNPYPLPVTQLWKSDGTEAGTVLVKDNIPENFTGVSHYTTIQSALYFTAGSQLWKSDGTPQGTFTIKTFDTQTSIYCKAMNGILYFTAYKYNIGTAALTLWKSNGTPEGTTLVKDLGNSTPKPLNPFLDNTYLTNLNGTLYFAAGANLWKSAGTEVTTLPIQPAGSSQPASSFPSNLYNANGILYFTVLDGAAGFELWKSNGTQAGSVLVKRNGGSGQKQTATILVHVNNIIFYAIDNYDTQDNLLNVQIWKSDGTATGTTLLKTITGVSYNISRINNSKNLNGIAYFIIGSQLWKSNGTSDGTLLVKELGNNQANNVTVINNTLYFSLGYSLWKSDGSTAGTVLVKNLAGSPENFTSFNNLLYFITSGGLWKSDGTQAGTMLVNELGSIGDISGLININGTLFFTALYGDTGYALCKSNGTLGGTVKVKDLGNYEYDEHEFENLTNVNGTLYFTYRAHRGGYPTYNELWKSDGTTEGTTLVSKIEAITLRSVNNTLFFSTSSSWNDSENGYILQLWMSNGTPESTKQLLGLTPKGYTAVGNTLYFSANDNKTGYELWKYDLGNCTENINKNLVVQGNSVCNGQNGTITIKATQAGVSYHAYVGNTLIGNRISGGGDITLTIPAVNLSAGNNTFSIQAIGCSITELASTATITLTASCTPPVTCSATGSILQEKWLNVSGSAISAIPVNISPSSAAQLTSFETTTQGDNYGERIRGYLCAPYSGSYTFYIAGDDQAQLYLSSDEDPAKKTRIASIAYFTGVKEWNKYPTQKSASISLVAGKKYYIEALHKEGLYSDNLAVGWQTPASEAVTVIAGAYLSPFIASCSNPAQSSLVVNPSSGGTLSGTTLYVKTIPGASSYTLQVSTSANFATGVITKTTASRLSTGTYYASFPELSLNQRYYVRVYTNLGLCFGPTTTFTTASAAASAYVTNPSDRGTTTGTSLYLNTVPGATTYTLQVSTSADFTSNVITRATVSRLSTGTYYGVFPELSLNGRYYVRVKTNLSDTWGRTTSFTRVSPAARLAAEEATESLENQVSLYPNPFEDKLTLVSGQAGKHSITIVDNLGRTVYQTTIQGVQTELNLAHLKAGVYVVKVSAEDGSTQVLRVVKQ